MSEWNPIATARRDGLALLLSTLKGVIVIGRYNKHLHIWQIAYWMYLPSPPPQESQ